MAYPAWDVGFEFGAFGRLFFEKLFLAWSICTALLLVLTFVPSQHLRIPIVGWVATAFPSVWLILALTARASPEISWLGYWLVGTGLVAYVLCFPYVLYLGISIAYPELLQNKRMQPRLALLSVLVILGVAGYLMGVNHKRLLSCEDFAVSGQFVPPDCHPEEPRIRSAGLNAVKSW